MAKEKQENGLETGIKSDGSIDVAVEQKEDNLVSETTKTLKVSKKAKARFEKLLSEL